MKNIRVKLYTMGVVLAGSLLLPACHDQLEQINPSAVPDAAARPGDILIATYSALRPYFNNSEYWAHSEISSDEAFVPQRGGDWADNGQWTQLHQHTWTPTHPLISGPWETAYRGIARANDVITRSGTATDATTKDNIAQARFLRAFFYYCLVDLYGNVPVLTEKVDPNNYPAQTPRAQVAEFIISECNAVINELPVTRPAGDFGRATKGAVQMLLAKMYLNGDVFMGAGKADWQKVIDLTTAVIAGPYSFTQPTTAASNAYLRNFSIELDGPANPEAIFVIGYNAAQDQGNTTQNWSNHYNFDKLYGNGQSPWNGFTTLADFYNTYSADDQRRAVWRIGQQYARDGVTKLKLRDNTTDLVYTPDVPVTGATEAQGIRILKWGPDPGVANGQSGNDFAIFRLADAYLMRAEAYLRQSNNVGLAVADVNKVRERAFEPDKPLLTVTLDDILKERGFELAWEGFRRQDLIRFGKFLLPNATKAQTSEPFRVLYPIPQRQIDINPKLKQNDGYTQ